MKVDVVMCTKNSEKILEKCVESIYREIPVCHFIVIDAFSTDKTVDILKKYIHKYKNLMVYQTSAKLGKAREIGIRNVDTEWFIFIDSDVILREKWFEKMIKYLKSNEEKIGAIESNCIHHYPPYSPKFPGFRGTTQFCNGEKNTRALTIATMIRTKAVRNIFIPSDLQIYEDEFIRRYVEKQGYMWIKVPEPIVDHYPTPKPWRDAYLAGIYSVRYHFISPLRILLVSFFSLLSSSTFGFYIGLLKHH